MSFALAMNATNLVSEHVRSIFQPRGTAALVLAIALVPCACFNPDEPRAESESTTDPTTANPSTSTADPSTSGIATTDADTTGIEPVDSTTDGGDTTGSTGAGESSEGDSSSGGSEGACGDGELDIATETCDDGNRMSGDLCDADCQVETLTYSFTGAEETLVLPSWVGQVSIEAWGAQGGAAMCCDGPMVEDGGLGGYASGTIGVASGATLTIFVGGQGVSAGSGGFGGGGAGGEWGAGGGGASDVRVGATTLVNRVLVAGGGGGGNCGCPDHGTGGAGGGLTGEAGISLQGYPSPGGGSQAAGGAAGENGTAGLLGTGGSSAAGDLYHFAGGGGGYYGGGGGYAVGAGGGSSYYGAAPDGTTMSGVRMGNGEVIITPVALP